MFSIEPHCLVSNPGPPTTCINCVIYFMIPEHLETLRTDVTNPSRVS